MKWTILQLFVLIELSLSLAPSDLLILILSQPDPYHIGLARNLREDIYRQSTYRDKDNIINIEILHEIVNHPGYWTFLAILPDLAKTGIIKSPIKWIVLCEDQSSVHVENLLSTLSEYDWAKDFYLGHPIYDKEATIIHHFAFFENPQWFSYPLIRSGVAFTASLVEKLTKRVQDEKPASDFFIDASHELSLFIWKNMRRTENNKLSPTSDISLSQSHRHRDESRASDSGSITDGGVATDDGASVAAASTHGNKKDTSELYKATEHKFLMTPSPYFCLTKGHDCAIYASQPRAKCDRIDADEIYFAIKTYHKFHNERLPTIEKTWGQYAIHKNFFSDINDDTIPTVSTNVPNTETGHCGKTLSIFKLALKDIDEMNLRLKKPIKWILLCDDDTLLSVSRVCDILGCYNATEHVYLGERYGFRLHSKDGFNYITGGGGMAFSLRTARKIISTCVCPTISSPDDMIIGICLQRQDIKAIHSSRFHQARPSDYSSELLSLDKPISFHKFWQIDPIRTYTKWFRTDDRTNSCLTKSKKSRCDMKPYHPSSLPQSTKPKKTPHIDL